MIVWRVNHDLPWPEPVECGEYGWPNKDATGAPMFDNTHFREEEACWASLLSNAEAGQALGVGTLQNARAAVARAMRALADDAVRYTAARLAHEQWKRGELDRERPLASRDWPTYAPGDEDDLPACARCGKPYGLHGIATNHCPTWAEEEGKGRRS